jgi:N-acetylglucosaminyl-diphospho-decaprenol L-rhamnosyltransferase
MLGPRLLDDDDRVQPSCGRFPTAGGTLVHETGLWKLLRRTPLAAISQPFYDPGCAAEVDWVLGAAMAMRRSAFDAVGGFDSSFFMYYEEVDLCRRLSATGATTRYAPDARIHHVGGASTRRDPAVMQRTMFRSLATYMRRHAHDPALLRLRGAVAITAVVKMARDLAMGPPSGSTSSRVASARSNAPILSDAVRGWPS